MRWVGRPGKEVVKSLEVLSDLIGKAEQIALGRKYNAELAAFRTAVATYRQRYGVS